MVKLYIISNLKTVLEKNCSLFKLKHVSKIMDYKENINIGELH